MLRTEYNDVVVDHFESPHNALPEQESAVAGAQLANCTQVSGQGGSVSGGVWIAFELEIERQVISHARFRVYGCPHSIALASWLTERLVGEKLDSSYTLDQREIVSVLELPTEKMRSVLVAEDALRACAHQLESKEAC